MIYEKLTFSLCQVDVCILGGFVSGRCWLQHFWSSFMSSSHNNKNSNICINKFSNKFKATPKDTWSKSLKKNSGKSETTEKEISGNASQNQNQNSEPVTPSRSWNEMLLDLIRSFIKFANQEKRAKRPR